jgi:hypothetical protein
MRDAMKRVVLIVALAGLLAGGCGSSMGKVKGQIVENGKPLSTATGTDKAGQGDRLAIELTLVGADGKLDTAKSYTAVVNADGSFEVLASKGEVQPGTYAVGIDASGKFKNQLKGFAPGVTRVRREIKAGTNDLTIDVTKPEG